MIINIYCNNTIGLFQKQINENTKKINLLQAKNRYIKSIITYKLLLLLCVMIVTMISCYSLFINYGLLKLVFMFVQSNNVDNDDEDNNNSSISVFYQHLDNVLLQQNYNKQFAIIKFMQQQNTKSEKNNKSLWDRIQLYFNQAQWEKYFKIQKQNFDNWLHSSLIEYYHGFIKIQKDFYSNSKEEYEYNQDNCSFIWKGMHVVKLDYLLHYISNISIVKYIIHYLPAYISMCIVIISMLLMYKSDILLNTNVTNDNIEEIYNNQQKKFKKYKENCKQKKIENQLRKKEKRKLLWDEHLKCQELDIPSTIITKKLLRKYKKYLMYKELQKELKKKHNANKTTSVNYDAEIYQNSHFKPENLK